MVEIPGPLSNLMQAMLALCQIMALGIGAPALAKVSPSPVRNKPVALLVWIEDERGTFSREQFENYSAAKSRDLGLPLRSLFVSTETDWASAFEELDRVVGPDERVAALTLATHGTTSRVLNHTILAELGSFGRFGTHGPLKDLIARLSGRWHDSVTIFLDSCSTFCGSETSVNARVRALYAEFNRAGVRKISIWGAHQPLDNDGVRTFGDSNENRPSQILKGGLLGSLLVGGLSYLQTSNPTVSALATAVSFLPATAIVRKFSARAKPGSMGSLVTIDAHGLENFEVDALDCETYFGRN